MGLFDSLVKTLTGCFMMNNCQRSVNCHIEWHFNYFVCTRE